MTNVLSPNQRQMNTLSEFRQLDARRHEEIASPDDDGDHAMIREIRRRAMDMVEEFDKLGVFQ